MKAELANFSDAQEYIRPSQIARFGISRSLLYEWMRDGTVRSFSPKRKGNIRGPRLVSVESIRAAIESQPEA